MTPKLLVIDIETSPHLADVWGLWNQNVGLNQLRESTRLICFAAKWVGESKVFFASEFHDGQEDMLALAYRLIDEADAVVHWNGTSFDMPHLNREFIKAGSPPPSPVVEIDLMKTAKRKFRFASNKLQYVSTYLGLDGKVQHEGHTLWVKCMAGDAKAWAAMRKYNKQDVVLTEQVYERLKPWISAHPNVNLAGGDGCPQCGSADLQKRGFATTQVSKFQRYRCNQCGAWSRSGKAETRVDIRGLG